MTTTDDTPLPEWMQPSVPEFYIDGYSFQGNPYTVHLSFTLGVPDGSKQEAARIRMSPEHAKIMSILFKRAMKEYERELKIEIPIPPAIIEAHKLNLEVDW